MAQHGLTLAQLQAAGCFAEPAPATVPGAVRDRNAHGQGWDGRGAMTDWLQRAIRAGQTAEHFCVAVAGITGPAVKGSSDLKSNGWPEVRRIIDESRPPLMEELEAAGCFDPPPPLLSSCPDNWGFGKPGPA